MRLLRRLRTASVAVVLSLAAAIGATGDDCHKTIFIYLDVSATMNRGKHSARALSGFAEAVRDLLRSDFVNSTDEIHVIIFADQTDELKGITTRDGAAAVLDQIAKKDGYQRLMDAHRQLDVKVTDIGLVLRHIQQARAYSEGPHYFIVASDFAHDPRDYEGQLNGNPNHRAQIGAAWDAEITTLISEIASQRSFGADEKLLALLPRRIQNDIDQRAERVLASLSKNFAAAVYRLAGTGFDEQDIRLNLAREPDVGVDLSIPHKAIVIPAFVRNPNPFRILVREIRAFDETQNSKQPENLPFASDKTSEWLDCGKRAVRELPAPPAAVRNIRIEAITDAKTQTHSVNLSTLNILSLEGAPFKRQMHGGSLVVRLLVDNELRSDTKMRIKIGTVTPEYVFTVQQEPGAQQFVIPIVPIGKDAAVLDKDGTVPVEIGLDDNAVLKQNGKDVTGPILMETASRWFSRHILQSIKDLGTVGSILTVVLAFFPGLAVKRRFLRIIIAALFALVSWISGNLPMDITGIRDPVWPNALAWSAIGGGTAFFVIRFLLIFAWRFIEHDTLLNAASAKRARGLMMAMLIVATVVVAAFLPLAFSSLWTTGEIPVQIVSHAP